MIGVKKKEEIFFDLFCEAFSKIMTAGDAFNDLVKNFVDVEKKVLNLKELETECDVQTHKILKNLNASFITPFDREDIYDIAKEMDNIVDILEEIANRFIVFDVKSVKQEALQMTELITICLRELKILFDNLKYIKKSKIIMDQVIEVNRIENEGDLVYREALTVLFRTEKDPIEIIKWKQLFDLLEDALDACEGVANIIEGVVMKHA
ncbi:DUF47 domain-containing protein [Anaerovorax odorimutans]|uniref:DUF47 domain-containing protein n=1 Tax=Anaerovorax odorimutans TaxID=109327 RepID=UPI000427BB39|nr:DUF47 family protein [Anaerovorax odorimutans]